MRTLLIATTCLVLAVIPAAAAEKSPPAGKVVVLEGSAVVVRAGEASGIPLSERSPVYSGDLIQTFADSRLKILFQDDSVVVIGPQSQFEVDENVYSAEKDERVAIFKLLTGKIRVLVGRHATAEGSRFEVSTPTAVTGVRGTHFIIEVTGEEETFVFTLDGMLSVASALEGVGGEIILEGNMMTQILSGQPPSLPQQIPDGLLKTFLKELALQAKKINIAGTGAGRVSLLKELLKSKPQKIRIVVVPDSENGLPQAGSSPFGSPEGWRALNPWIPRVALRVNFPGNVYQDILWNIVTSGTLRDMVGN